MSIKSILLNKRTSGFNVLRHAVWYHLFLNNSIPISSKKFWFLRCKWVSMQEILWHMNDMIYDTASYDYHRVSHTFSFSLSCPMLDCASVSLACSSASLTLSTSTSLLSSDFWFLRVSVVFDKVATSLESLLASCLWVAASLSPSDLSLL